MGKNKAVEVWVDILGYEGIYQVSNHGRLKKLKREWFGGNGGKRTTEEKIIKPHYSKFGYNHQSFIKEGKIKDMRACRLVAIHFIPNSENKPFVNHIDGDKANDYFENLEWNTSSENTLHAFRTGLIKPRAGSLNGMAAVSEKIVLKIRNEYKEGKYKWIARKYGLTDDHVGQIVRRNTWKHI